MCADTTWDGSTYGGDGQNKNVTATFIKEEGTKYDVTISWDALNYTYPGIIRWNGETYDAVYSEGDEIVPWIGDNYIRIKNNSEMSINAVLEFEENGEYYDAEESEIMGGFLGTNINESYCDGKTIFPFGTNAMVNTNPTEDSIKVLVGGFPKGIKPVYNNTNVDLTNTGIPIGTVTVTITVPQ